MIKSKLLSRFSDINHGFFNKNGGVSRGKYESLNCGLGSKDQKKHVKKNLKIVAKKINTSIKKLILLNQTHSNKFYFINKNYKFKKKLVGDALITNIKNIAVGVLTADCVPILIFDKNKKIISAIHSGWRGIYNEIIIKVTNFIIKKGSKKKNLFVAIGPCIGKKNYEVQKDFMIKFIKKDTKYKKFFYFKKNKTYFCLNECVYYQFKKQGIKNLEIINKDTYESKNKFFSARKSIKNKEDDYGRNISIIMIN